MSNYLSFDLSSVPRDWLVIPCGVFFKEKSIKNTEGEMNLSVYRDYGVIPKDSRDDNHNRVSEDTSNYKLVEPGDFVLNKMKGWSGSLGVSDYRGIVSPSYTVLEPVKEIHNKYFHYLLRSETYRQMYESLSYGVRIGQWELRYHDFKQIPSLYPSIEEQKLISRYLDKKTSQIDSLVEKIQKKIELLKEQRTSLINHYVTKGLDPNVETKDSGVEWVDRIPKTWSKSRLDFLTKLNGRLGWKSLKSDEYVEEGYVFLSTPNIKNWDIDFVNVNYITEERYVESPEIMLEEGDVLLVKDGSTLGITNYVRNLPRPSTVNSSIGVLKTTSSQLLPEFLFWSLSGNYIQNVIQRIKGGMGVPHLFQSDIKKFVVFLPPIEDQLEICQFLNYQIPKLNELIKSHVHKINCYKEYRQSLVSSVVTGKVRVTEDMI